jgi:septum formation protein
LAGGLKILLASSSPRRIELLGQLGLNFTHVAPDVEEDESSLDPVERVEGNARRKAMSVSAPNSIVIGADTLVELDGQILGKPSDEKEAKIMLASLSGRVHHVYSGLSLVFKGKSVTRHACTKVWFRTLSDKEIDDYVESGEPKDKAGSYGIQGSGRVLVEKIEGSYSNVVGLPLELLEEMFLNLGIKP